MLYACVYNINKGYFMVNRRKQKFTQTKMLSSRVEMSDYLKLERWLETKNLSVQQFVNSMVRSVISGTAEFSGSLFYSK